MASYEEIKKQMEENSILWHKDPANRKKYEDANKGLGAQLGAGYDSSSGTWNKDGNTLYTNSDLWNRESNNAANNAQNAYLEKAFQESQNANRYAVENNVNQLERYKPELAQQKTMSLQEAYIRKAQAEAAMPQMMAAQGITGGGSESSKIALDAQYGNEQSATQKAYMDAVMGINNKISDVRASGQAQDSAATSAYMQQLSAMLQQQTEAARQQSNWDKQFNFGQEQYKQGTAQQVYENRINEAWKWAQGGDFSKLKALGMDTADLESQYAAQSNMQAVTAKSSGGGNSGGGGGDYKPTLTVAQVEKAIESGNTQPNVLKAYEHYYGAPFAPTVEKGMSERAKAFEQSMGNKRNPLTGAKPAIEEIDFAIKSAFKQGVLTEQEAKAIGKKYGIEY